MLELRSSSCPAMARGLRYTASEAPPLAGADSSAGSRRYPVDGPGDLLGPSPGNNQRLGRQTSPIRAQHDGRHRVVGTCSETCSTSAEMPSDGAAGCAS
jgi:hypothetical protein